MNINIWVTKKCNLNCTYCYEGIYKETESMEMGICNKIITYTKKINEPINIRFHGGEPLLEYEKLQYLYKELKKNKNIKTFGITTNATLLNEQKIEFLSKAMDDFSISIDGGKEIHDRNRKYFSGMGSYDKLIQVIPEVLKKKPYARARMTVTPETVPYLYESVESIINLGFKVIAIAVNVFDNKWNEDNKKQYFDAVKCIYDKYNGNKEIHISVIERDSIKKLASCGGGKDSIHIAIDGTFYPCSFSVGIRDFAIGNIDSGIEYGKVEEITKIGKIINKDCIGCTVYDFCPGTRCKIINKIISGAYDMPPFATCMDMNVKVSILY